MSTSRNTHRIIRQMMPTPIAEAWHRVQLARDGVERVKRLTDCLDVTLRLASGLVLADYVRGPKSATVEQHLKGLRRPSLGHYWATLRDGTRHSAARGAQHSPFFPEAQRWLFNRHSKPTRTFGRLTKLVELRNQDVHGHAPPPAGVVARVQEISELLTECLGEARWLCDYRIIRVSDQRTTRQHREGRVMHYKGIRPEAPQSACWSPDLYDGALYAVSPDGARLLDLSPFFGAHRPKGLHEHRLLVFLSANVDAAGHASVTLRDDETGVEQRTLPYIGGQQVSLSTWLDRRGEIEASIHNDLPEDLRDLGAEPVVDPGDSYRILGELGSGGMATVYAAEDRRLGRRVALKVLNGAHASDVRLSERFRREGRTMARLDHDHVLKVLDVHTLPDGRPSIVMPLVEGGTLRERLESSGPQSAAAVLSWATQVLGALDYLHRQGICHRDVKPSNLLLDSDDDVLLADFGVAADDANAQQLTQTHERVGSLPYMAPELVRGRARPSLETDLYSLGVTLHELSTGAIPEEPGDGIGGKLGELVRVLCGADAARREECRAILASRDAPSQPKADAGSEPREARAASEAGDTPRPHRKQDREEVQNPAPDSGEVSREGTRWKEVMGQFLWLLFGSSVLMLLLAVIPGGWAWPLLQVPIAWLVARLLFRRMSARGAGKVKTALLSVCAGCAQATVAAVVRIWLGPGGTAEETIAAMLVIGLLGGLLLGLTIARVVFGASDRGRW